MKRELSKEELKEEPIYEGVCFFLTKDSAPIIQFKDSGEVLVKGELIEKNVELVEAFKEFLKDSGYL